MILVTGGTGLVGSHVLLELLSRNKPVRALYRSEDKKYLVREVFAHYGSEGLFDRVDWVKADVEDVTSLEKAMEGCNQVYHTAAYVSMRGKDFHKMMQINVGGTENVVNLALDMGVEKLCHVSSTASLGDVPHGQVLDESAPHPRASESYAYSISKFNSERQVWRGVEEGLHAVIVNPAIILGPSDWYTSSSSIFRALSRGLAYYPKGVNGFVDVRDVARAMVELMEQDVMGERFLVSGHTVPFKEPFQQIASAFGAKVPQKELQTIHIRAAIWFDSVRKLLTGKAPRVTKHSAFASQNVNNYSSQKLKDRLDFEFLPMEETIANAVGFYRKKYKV